jgi:hypothetical protein
MKKSILVAACISLSLAVIISRSWAGPGTAATKEKEAVDKVLQTEKFTPTVEIEGPSNSVWFVASRVFGAKGIEQVIVNVHGKTANVQMATYVHDGRGWHRNNGPSVVVTDLQRKIENEVGKEK